jgi:uncharacterized protein (TIGR02145 family)
MVDGLENVNNTSDEDKPVSSATQTALATKAPINNPQFTGTVSGITKSMVDGLENVNNTSDEDKPVSKATQDALALKAPLANPTFTGTVGGITQAMVDGLENVNNTSDEDKPVSTATQTALAAKAPINNPKFTGTVGGITQAMVDGLENVNNTSDEDKPVSTATQTALDAISLATQTALDAISLATQTALDAKAPINNPQFTGTVGGITKAMVDGLENVENTSDLDKPVSIFTQAAIDTKLNKSDFPSGNFANEILYWNGDYWISLAPGTKGQSLIMSSTGGLSWGCLIPSSVGTPSSISPTLMVNTPMTPITIATTGVTGILFPILPWGLEAKLDANVLTISGTPYEAGSLVYYIQLEVSCGEPLIASGTININPTVPYPPTDVVATAGNTLASVAFVAPNFNGGSIITGYTVTSDPGGFSATGDTSPLNVIGLTNGTDYTFTVIAVNVAGPSIASDPSAPVTPAPPPSACPDPTVTDIDGNIYNTVGIGNQCWTKENLRVSSYNDGTLISVVPDAGPWVSPEKGIRSWYNNDSTTNEIPYGNLYNWYAVQGRDVSLSVDTPKDYIYKNICPTGWHVPTDSDWNKLVKSIDSAADTSAIPGVQSSTVGGNMKSMGTTYWSSESTGTNNSSGFSALPGGIRQGGDFIDIRTTALFWSVSEINGSSARGRQLDRNDGVVYRGTNNKSSGASVRCLKD